MGRYDAGQEPISVTPAIHHGLHMVRMIGTYNMFDVPAVVDMARQLGQYATADWIEKNRAEYSKGLLFGFEPVAIDWDNVRVIDFEDCKCGCEGRRLCAEADGESDEA